MSDRLNFLRLELCRNSNFILISPVVARLLFLTVIMDIYFQGYHWVAERRMGTEKVKMPPPPPKKAILTDVQALKIKPPWIVAEFWLIYRVPEKLFWHSLLEFSLLLWKREFSVVLSLPFIMTSCNFFHHCFAFFSLQTLSCYVRFITSVSCFVANTNHT